MLYAIMTKRGFLMDPSNLGFMLACSDVEQVLPLLKKGNSIVSIPQTARHERMQQLNAVPDADGKRRYGK